jgi:DNA-binding transcriptional LysR family regulator
MLAAPAHPRNRHTVVAVATNREHTEAVYEPVQLRTFVTVGQARSFTRAAELLSLSASAVSQHIRKLEQACGRLLLDRDTHRVRLTADGEAMLGFAQAILDSHAAARDYFTASRPGGLVRFGISEDFAEARMPAILRTLRQRYPDIELELTVDLSGVLYERLRAGQLDLILAKRVTGAHPVDSQVVATDRLVWLAAKDFEMRPHEPLPLVLYPEPSVTRQATLDVLRRRKVPFRIACTASSLSGLRAAAIAGMGVLTHAQSLTPPSLHPVDGLPDLGSIDLALATRRHTPSPAEQAVIAVVGMA